jgi:hypothetical protein
MEMGEFMKTFTGRLLAVSWAIALGGGGAAMLIADAGASRLLMTASLFIPGVINIVGLPNALAKHWYHAVMCGIMLPPGLWLYAIGLANLREQAPGWGAGLVVLGLGALVLAARGEAGAPAPAAAAEQH